jgi:signal transduction histidine kinase
MPHAVKYSRREERSRSPRATTVMPSSSPYAVKGSALEGKSSRIFDRFERVETGIASRIAGTGLGLSVARECAGLHGARFWVKSEPGLGSTLYLALPASTESGVGVGRRRRDEDGKARGES